MSEYGAMRVSGHHCHARECKTACAPKLLMCPKHWRMVPVGLQRAVLESFNSAQCWGSERVHPSGAWMVAADAAILAVWLMEGPHESLEQVKRICEGTMYRAARYAADMDEDWRVVLKNILPCIPGSLISDAVKRMLVPQSPRRRIAKST